MTCDVSQMLHDPARLAVLHDLELLDAPPDPVFDRLVYVAALTVNAPTALVVIFDADRLFFQSSIGLREPWASRRQAPLSDAFCEHILVSSEPSIVDDAHRNPTFTNNPVISNLGVVAYLGIPLVSMDGYVIGSFCVIDSMPRVWTTREVHILQELGSLAMAEIEGRHERRTRQRAEDALREAHDELEQRVHARTAELIATNAALQAEITERKRIEEALRVSEFRYRTMIEQAPVSIQVLAPDGRTLQVNRAWEELWGVKLDHIPEYNVLKDEQLVIKGVMPFIKRAFAGEVTELPEILYDPEQTLPDRSVHSTSPRMVRAIMSPVKDQDGVVREVILIHEDVTDRQQAERSLRLLAEASTILGLSLDYEATLSSVVHLMVPRIADACLLHIIEPDQQYYYEIGQNVSPATATLLYELADVYRVDQDNPDDLISRSLRTGESVLVTEGSELSHELATQIPAVQRIYHELNPTSFMIVPLAAHGRVLGTIACGTLEPFRRYGPADLALVEDLARRAAVAVDHARLYREAQEALKTRDEFLSIAAHELKTPLTTLLGHTQGLQRRMARTQALSERDQHVLHVLGEQALRLNRQIETLLDLTRIERGQFHMDFQPLNLCGLARQIVEEFETTTERHTMSLHCTEQALMVQGDEQRLGQVIQNLVQNAIKYSPQGGAITICVDRREEQATIAVGDEGIGIPESARPHLFERFYRARDTSDWHIEGTGIGLYLVHEIVTRHSGAVEVSSTQGQGSTFTIVLPLIAG